MISQSSRLFCRHVRKPSSISVADINSADALRTRPLHRAENTIGLSLHEPPVVAAGRKPAQIVRCIWCETGLSSSQPSGSSKERASDKHANARSAAAN